MGTGTTDTASLGGGAVIVGGVTIFDGLLCWRGGVDGLAKVFGLRNPKRELRPSPAESLCRGEVFEVADLLCADLSTFTTGGL